MVGENIDGDQTANGNGKRKRDSHRWTGIFTGGAGGDPCTSDTTFPRSYCGNETKPSITRIIFWMTDGGRKHRSMVDSKSRARLRTDELEGGYGIERIRVHVPIRSSRHAPDIRGPFAGGCVPATAPGVRHCRMPILPPDEWTNHLTMLNPRSTRRCEHCLSAFPIPCSYHLSNGIHMRRLQAIR